MRSPIALLVPIIMILIGFSLSPSAFAQVTFEDFHAGSQSQDVRTSSSYLAWEFILQDGTITGRTDSQRAISFADSSFGTLSFSPEQDPLSTVIEVRVEGFTDQLNIGNIYCFEEPNWNFKQTIFVNSIPYDFPLQRFGMSEFNDSTQVAKSLGIKFTPSLIERFLTDEGVVLQNNDKIVWKVIADNRFTVVEGFINEPLINIGNLLFVQPTFGQCQVTGKGYDLYATGMVIQLSMTWFDPVTQFIDSSSIVDTDGDGIPDNVDCDSFLPETINGFEDLDGCPDVVPVPSNVVVEFGEVAVINEVGDVIIILDLDFDNDGIPNDIDDCPNDPENFNGINDQDGCPDIGGFIDLQGLKDPISTLPPKFVSSNPVSPLHTDVETELIIEQGETNECDNAINDCNIVIANAIRSFEMSTGINLPFIPTVFNLVLLFGMISAIIIIVLVLLRRIKIGKR